MRKLLASLLFLPVLFGGTGGSDMPVEHAPSAFESVEAATARSSQLPLPGHMSAAAFAAPGVLLEVGSGDTWRTPARSGRAAQQMPPAHARDGEARTHLDRLQRSRLDFRQSLARARANEPTTFGNPPPASPT